MRPLVLLAVVATAACAQQYCKCQCGKQLVAKIDRCGLCIEDWCLEQDPDLCKGSEPGAMVISCFQKESVKEKTAVVVFVVAVLGLLVKQLLSSSLVRGLT